LATGQNIADEARGDLNDGDASNYRWSDAEVLRFVNAAQRQIVFMLPEANVVEEKVDLVAGARQTLPARGVKFFALYNADLVGEAFLRGSAITVVEEDALDSSFPTWMTEEIVDTDVIDHVIHDPRDPKTYSVYPAPADGNVDAILKHAKLPTDLASLASTFGLGDEYINAAVEYTKFRMLTKDGRYGSEPAVRLELWNNFRMALGLKPQTDMRVDPSRERAGGDANG
jgi:hypothetical protein